MKPGNNNAITNEDEIAAQLKKRLAEDVAWKSNIEDLLRIYGNQNQADITALDRDKIWKLWTASKFAETGSHSLPTPTETQWNGLREMTRLLCDRTRSPGERFIEAKKACEKTFTTDHVQLPVILRTLLILERGRFGTVATKKHTNLLLKWCGSPELDYSASDSITSALESVSKLIENWAIKVGVSEISDTARLPWYLCEILGSSNPKSVAGVPSTLDQLWSKAESLINSSGFMSQKSLVGRFLAALAAKPFVILTGNSGTGKTQLAKLIADWLSSSGTTGHSDPFSKGVVIESDRIKYYVMNSDNHSVEFWNNEQEDEAIKVSLPHEMIDEWADVIRSRHFTQETPARAIREAVVPHSRFSSQLHSFETHLKAAALALLNAQTTEVVGRFTSSSGYALVPVGADWTDNRNVVGFVNHLRKDALGMPIYQPTPVLELLVRATADPSHPYFLILDEMNLSHVERYFSDILSAMESKKSIPLHNEDQSLRTPSGDFINKEISFPDNLFLIGTVNVDETTYMFSPKVLDRANVIEFHVDDKDIERFLDDPRELTAAPAAGEATAKGFLQLALDARSGKLAPLLGPEKIEINKHLINLLEIMQRGRFEFAFRTANEVTRYLRVCKHLAEDKVAWGNGGALSEDELEAGKRNWLSDLDDEILQKILPRLHGSRNRLGSLLGALACYLHTGDRKAADDYFPEEGAELAAKSIGDTDFRAMGKADALFPRSFGKIRMMSEILVEEQFVSFIC